MTAVNDVKGCSVEGLCVTCPWWVRLPDRIEYRWSVEQGDQVEIRSPNDAGECRRHPPRPPREFPRTTPDDWCAEHPERGGRAAAG